LFSYLSKNGISPVIATKTWPFLVLGFGAGLPYLLVFSTLSAWLSEAGVAKTLIGYLSLVGITYSLKFLWAPLLDRISIPYLHRLGRRRSWLLCSQTAVVVGLIVMSMSMSMSPSETQLIWLTLGALIVAFASATQDIALDAYRIEALENKLQGLAVAQYIFGYRTALLCSGAGALFIADVYDWSFAYLLMSLAMLPAMLLVFWLTETKEATALIESKADSLPTRISMIECTKGSFLGFFNTHGRMAWPLLALIAVYRLTDMSLGVMAIPFYLETGFSKSEVAAVSKLFGFGMTLLGSALGGWMVLRLGQVSPLIWGAWLSLLTNGLYILLDVLGADVGLLAFVIGADNLGGGIANVALVAFMSSLTQNAYTATQYALLSSLMTLLGKLVSGLSGWVVDQFGFTSFFIYTAVLGVPALWLSSLIANRQAVHQIKAQLAAKAS
jgi:PAT family beta-lactamase induction signal transducer AmpG